MRLAASQEIAAPIEEAWAGVVDVDRLEQQARARDPDLRRIPDGPPAPGTRWEMTVPVQGRARSVVLEMVELDPPRTVVMRARLEGVELTSRLAFEPLGADRARLALAAEARASGLAGRLLLGALLLAQPQVERRLAARLADAARRIEAGRA